MDSEFKIEDKKLVERTIAGSVKAYDELYMRYCDQVLSMLISKCGGDEDLAEDITQDTFIKAFVNIDKYDPRYTFGQWVFTIARNLFIDHTRKRKSARHEFHDDNTPCDMPNPEQRIIESQNTREFEQAILRLPERYRTIFVMRYMDDLSYEEISVMLSIPMGTVKTQIHRARDRFMKELGVDRFDQIK